MGKWDSIWHEDTWLCLVMVLALVRKTTLCYFYLISYIYIIYTCFQGQSRIRPDISGIADLGESAKGRDKTCPGRAHLSPDKDCNGHRYSTKCTVGVWWWNKQRFTQLTNIIDYLVWARHHSSCWRQARKKAKLESHWAFIQVVGDGRKPVNQSIK